MFSLYLAKGQTMLGRISSGVLEIMGSNTVSNKHVHRIVNCIEQLIVN